MMIVLIMVLMAKRITFHSNCMENRLAQQLQGRELEEKEKIKRSKLILHDKIDASFDE